MLPTAGRYVEGSAMGPGYVGGMTVWRPTRRRPRHPSRVSRRRPHDAACPRAEPRHPGRRAAPTPDPSTATTHRTHAPDPRTGPTHRTHAPDPRGRWSTVEILRRRSGQYGGGVVRATRPVGVV